jgi:hypothetical protein
MDQEKKTPHAKKKKKLPESRGREEKIPDYPENLAPEPGEQTASHALQHPIVLGAPLPIGRATFSESWFCNR